MFSLTTLWIPFTITAALGQVARNAMQRQLTGPLGTWGATNIRFLFGFPFSVLFFVLVIAATGDAVPWPTAAFWPWLWLGTISQIVATGLMLVAMNDRSFVVTTAYLKTEAVQTAIFGFVFLGDHLTLLKVVAILIGTAGVVITALRPGAEKGFAELKPTIIGLAAAAAFALSANGFRGAIITVQDVSFVTAASYTLVFGLFVQTLVLTIYLLARAPDVLTKILGLWKPSMLAGFMGAFASQFWFLAFALTAAANVRTLRSEEHTSELQSRQYLVCRLLLEKKKKLLNPAPPTHTYAVHIYKKHKGLTHIVACNVEVRLHHCAILLLTYDVTHHAALIYRVSV